jgi:hypothetical protein
MEKLGLSTGVSLVIYPILLLWTGLVGLRLGLLYAWLPPIVGIGILLWSIRSRIFRRRPPAEAEPHSNTETKASRLSLRRFTPSLHTIVLALVVVLLIFTRFWAIRTLDAPMWGDSYQHTVIAQLIADHNGLFRSWQPYADLQTFTYHFGFHSAVAVFHWVTDLAIPRCVLWVGQIFNILAVLCLYPLATKVCKNRWSGVAAVIIAGFLAPVPMTYTNWGRYPQLAGQIVLVVAIYMLWSVLVQSSVAERTTLLVQSTHTELLPVSNTPRTDWRSILLAAIVMGGLAITHFRVLIFAVLFLLAIFVSFIFTRGVGKAWKSIILRTFWMGLGGGIIFLPWFVNLYGGKILRNFTNQVITPASVVSTELQSYNAVGSLLQYLPVGLWLLLPLAIAWGMWKQHRGIALVSLWGFLLLVFANPSWLSLPGTGALSNFAIFIAVYILAAILIGGAIGLLAEEFLSGDWQADLSIRISSRWKANLLRLGIVGVQKNTRLSRWGNGLIAVVLVGIGLTGVPGRLSDLQPERYALLTRPDLRAASWIRDNLPTDANLLVNSMFAYGGSLLVGTDGGWWLPVLTKRQITVPPLNYGTERGPRTDFRKWINALPKAIETDGVTNPDVLQIFLDRKITYVYIGQQQGRVNNNGPVELDPSQLSNDPHFRTIYHQDRVWIFEIVLTP